MLREEAISETSFFCFLFQQVPLQDRLYPHEQKRSALRVLQESKEQIIKKMVKRVNRMELFYQSASNQSIPNRIDISAFNSHIYMTQIFR